MVITRWEPGLQLEGTWRVFKALVCRNSSDFPLLSCVKDVAQNNRLLGLCCLGHGDCGVPSVRRNDLQRH
ncbi:unnamed protein product [Bursaphelenchus xylophilus]|nr:unnamed protein product [Bursaphelenchus xylophilus]CAG9113342.1 unnamed protein product [Bursaphelenchus xylophilus]